MNNAWILEMNRENLLKLLLIDEDLSARVSDLFLRQLQVGIANESLHSQMVMEEIFTLEGRGKSRTKTDEPFRGRHLSGLCKKHFYQTVFICRNLQNEWKMQSAKSGKLRGMIHRNLNNIRDPLKLSQQIASEFVKALSDRERRGDLDGEWIVFAQHEGKNFYLTLASHKECDNEIRTRVLNFCGNQFYFLNFLIENKA